MSAIPIINHEYPETWTGQDIHVALIRRLQEHARGVGRARRSLLHRQFAYEWRLLQECGGIQGSGISEEFPLLRSLYRYVLGIGEPLVLSRKAS